MAYKGTRVNQKRDSNIWSWTSQAKKKLTVLDYNPKNKINIYESTTDINKNWINKSRRDNFPSGRIPIHIGYQ